VKGLAVFGFLVAALAASGQEPSTGSTSAAATSPDLTPTPAPAPRTAAETPGTAARPIGTGSGSLADIAKKQKEKREQEGKRPSLGLISNQTLKKGSAAEAPPKNGAKAKPSPTATPRSPSIPEFRDLNGRNEAEWRRMVNAARGRVTAAEGKVASLEAETKKLENDFYAWSDGNFRDRVIRPAWDQAREELGKARKELDAARTGITDLEDEARKSGAPPGWLR
jgi:BMFP domain-containing protein YqiC